MLAAQAGFLPDEVINKFSRNEHRAEIPNRVLRAFMMEEAQPEVVETKPSVQRRKFTEAEAMDINVWIDQWPEFCKEFGLAVEVDFAALKKDERITKRRKGFDWIVYCPQSFTAEQALQLSEKQGVKVYREIPVDKYSLERKPFRTNLVLCRATIEPDKEWLGKSADDMSATTTPFMDARERYTLEAFYFWLTGKHLDIKGWTRCPRSRTSDGRVASASWHDGEFYAYWFYADHRRDCAGGREVVSLNPEN